MITLKETSPYGEVFVLPEKVSGTPRAAFPTDKASKKYFFLLLYSKKSGIIITYQKIIRRCIMNADPYGNVNNFIDSPAALCTFALPSV